jgi:hypothetical protein
MISRIFVKRRKSVEKKKNKILKLMNYIIELKQVFLINNLEESSFQKIKKI